MNDAGNILGHFQGTDDFAIFHEWIGAVNGRNSFPRDIHIGLNFFAYFNPRLQNFHEGTSFIR
ncbi:hypothetical protein D3C86_2262920 [compost metagenome]